MALNSVNLCGRLVKDPELSNVKGDLKVCRFTLAVDKKKKDAGANFIDCVAWNKSGETIAQYAKKGNKFAVSGFLDQQSWEKDGQKQTKISVVVTDFMFLESKSQDSSQSAMDEITEDMIPFN